MIKPLSLYEMRNDSKDWPTHSSSFYAWKKLRVHSNKTKQDCIIIAIVIIIIILTIVIMTVLSSLSILLSFLRYEQALVKRVIP